MSLPLPREDVGGPTATAWATGDGTVEVIEDSDRPFVLFGVLWHPEENAESQVISVLVQEVSRARSR